METNRPTKYIRIHTAQTGGNAPIVDAFQVGVDVIKNIGKGLKPYEADAKGQDAFDKQIQPAVDIAVSDLKTRALFESRGLGSRYDAFASQLTSLMGDEEHQKIVMNADVPRLLSAISQASTVSMAPIEAIYDLATKIYFQTPDVSLVEQTLDTIGKFENKMPGISFWEDAVKAANHEDYSGVYNLKKMAVIGIGAAKNFGEFRDLDTAIGYAHSPGSEFDREMMEKMRSDQAARRSMETSGIMTARMLADYKKQQNDAKQMVNKFFQDNFQKITDNKLFDTWMRTLMGIGVVATGKNLFLSVANPAASTGLMAGAAPSGRGAFPAGRGASSRKSFTRVAQAPQDLRPGTSGAPGVTAPGVTAPGVTAPGVTAPGETSGNGSAQDPNKQKEDELSKNGYEALKDIEAFQNYIKLELQYNNLMSGYKQLKAAIVSSQYQGNTESLSSSVLGNTQVPMADAEQIVGLSLQLKNIIGQLFQLNGPIVQAMNALKSDPDYIHTIETDRAAKQIDAGISAFQYQLLANQELLRNELVVTEENINLAPLITQINALSIAEAELEATYNAVKENSPYGSMPAAQEYRSVLNQIADLYQQLAMKYAKMSNESQMEQLKRVYAFKARLSMKESERKTQKAIEVRNQSYFGTKSASAVPYLFEKTAEKIEEDLEREADARIRRYFDNLYEDTPGSPDVGTVLDDPAAYRGVLTTDVGKARKYRRHRSRPAHKA